MQNVFGINRTYDKKNTAYDGNVYLTKSISPELGTTIYTTIELHEDIAKKAKLPRFLRFVKAVTGTAAGIYILVALRALLSGVTLAEQYGNAPVLPYIALASLMVWLLLTIAARRRIRSVLESDEYKSYTSRMDYDESSYKEEFNIPPDVKTIDFLSYKYDLMGVKEKVMHDGITKYLNIACWAYVRDGSLHINARQQEWSIPLRAFTGITRINKRISVPNWNKETPFNKGEFKQYKLRIKNGALFFKPYYDIIITGGTEEFKLSIPSYEREALLSLIGNCFRE
jgi:hypothetical protein